jgi:hypothetical protein
VPDSATEAFTSLFASVYILVISSLIGNTVLLPSIVIAPDTFSPVVVADVPVVFPLPESVVSVEELLPQPAITRPERTIPNAHVRKLLIAFSTVPTLR